jgi:hypothetical protein
MSSEAQRPGHHLPWWSRVKPPQQGDSKRTNGSLDRRYFSSWNVVRLALPGGAGGATRFQ